MVAREHLLLKFQGNFQLPWLLYTCSVHTYIQTHLCVSHVLTIWREAQNLVPKRICQSRHGGSCLSQHSGSLRPASSIVFQISMKPTCPLVLSCI